MKLPLLSYDSRVQKPAQAFSLRLMGAACSSVSVVQNGHEQSKDFTPVQQQFFLHSML